MKQLLHGTWQPESVLARLPNQAADLRGYLDEDAH